jgi:hypothetical protein
MLVSSIRPSAACCEEGGQSSSDVIRDQLGGTILRVTLAAVPGKALRLAWDVITDLGEGPTGEDRLS